MSASNPQADHPSDPSRAEARREQILSAAADCFREHGFHGASIALIGKAAGMSPGHIYHYFDNKEAIIAMIVGKEVDRLLALTAALRAACDVREAMIDRASENIARALDPQTASLKVEIVAEAARNPRIAQIVQEADRLCLASLVETIRHVRRERGHHDSEQHLHALAEVLASMFEGLLIRTIRNPGLDQADVLRVFQHALSDLLDQPAA